MLNLNDHAATIKSNKIQFATKSSVTALFLRSQSDAWLDAHIDSWTSFCGAFGGSLWALLAQTTPDAAIYKAVPVVRSEMFAALKGFGSVAWMWVSLALFLLLFLLHYFLKNLKIVDINKRKSRIIIDFVQ